MVTNGLALAAHFGDGALRAADVASGLIGAIVKDPVQDRVVWLEYLETVVKERDGWKDLYRACRESGCDARAIRRGGRGQSAISGQLETPRRQDAKVRELTFYVLRFVSGANSQCQQPNSHTARPSRLRHSPPRPGVGAQPAAALEELRPDVCWWRDRPTRRGAALLAHAEMQPPVALLVYTPDEPHRARLLPFRGLFARMAGHALRLEHDIPVRFMDLPQAIALLQGRKATAATPPDHDKAKEVRPTRPKPSRS